MFVKQKQATLQVILSNVHPAIVQQMKSIKDYKQVEKKKKDLIRDLLILKDFCFVDRNGGLTFQLVTSLGQCQ